MNKNTIGFHNRNQVVLFEAELKGQISDGMWENARPSNHYHAPCDSTAYVATDDSGVGRNFHARAYNFNNNELVEIIGDRMINFVKLSQAFPQLAISQLFDIDSNVHDTISNMERYAQEPGDGYWLYELTALRSSFGVGTTDELISLLETRMATVNYTLPQLRKDLNDMKKCWKIVR